MSSEGMANQTADTATGEEMRDGKRQRQKKRKYVERRQTGVTENTSRETGAG